MKIHLNICLNTQTNTLFTLFKKQQYMIKLYHSLVLFKYMSLFQYDFWFTAFGKTSAKAVASSARTALGALGAREGGKQRG